MEIANLFISLRLYLNLSPILSYGNENDEFVKQSHLFPQKIMSRHFDLLQIHQYYYQPKYLRNVLT